MMNTRPSLLLSGLLVVGLSFAATALKAQTTRLVAKPGSSVRLDGTSTIHDWTIEGRLIGGSAEVGAGFPLEPGQAAAPGRMDVNLEAFIPVRSLKSVKDGKPYSKKMDEVTYEKLLEAQHKRITYRLTELELKETPQSAGSPYRFESKGELVVAGVTNALAMPVNVTPKDDGKVVFALETDLKMTDFDIEPVKISILGIGAIKTGDDVKVRIEWVTAVAPKQD